MMMGRYVSHRTGFRTMDAMAFAAAASRAEPAALSRGLATGARALADQLLEELQSRKRVAGGGKIAGLVDACETRDDLEKAVEVLRLSRGLLNNRKQLSAFSTNVTRALVESSAKAGAADLLLDLVRDRNLLGLPFSKARLGRVLRGALTDHDPVSFLDDDRKLWEMYDSFVSQVKEESGTVSRNLLRHLLRHLVRHGKAEVAAEMAKDASERLGLQEAETVGVVERFARDMAAGEPEEPEEGEGEVEEKDPEDGEGKQKE